jgi:hypothetical protein
LVGLAGAHESLGSMTLDSLGEHLVALSPGGATSFYSVLALSRASLTPGSDASALAQILASVW